MCEIGNTSNVSNNEFCDILRDKYVKCMFKKMPKDVLDDNYISKVIDISKEHDKFLEWKSKQTTNFLITGLDRLTQMGSYDNDDMCDCEINELQNDMKQLLFTELGHIYDKEKDKENLLISLMNEQQFNINSMSDMRELFCKFLNTIDMIVIIKMISNIKDYIPVQLQSRTDTYNKFLFTMFGTCMCQLYCLKTTDNKSDISKTMLKALKIGYYYGLSYILIDDVMDEPDIITKDQKKELCSFLVQFCKYGILEQAFKKKNNIFKNVYFVMNELLLLCPYNDKKEVYNNLLLLLQSQIHGNYIMENLNENANINYNSTLYSTYLKSIYSRLILSNFICKNSSK